MASQNVRGAVAKKQQDKDTPIGAFDPNDQRVIRYLGLNPDDPKSQAVVAVARQYDLDPVLKHVIVIPGGGVYITRDGYLHVAHRSEQLDGIVVEQEPALGEDGQTWVARVTVYRKDMSHGFTYPGRYPASGKNREYAPEMALKAAESHALRRAFNVSGAGSAEEARAEHAEEQDIRRQMQAEEPDLWEAEAQQAEADAEQARDDAAAEAQ